MNVSPYAYPGTIKKEHKKKAVDYDYQGTINAVCELFNTSLPDLKDNKKNRKRENVMARQIIMSLLHLRHNFTQQAAGQLFFNKEHATVIHSMKTIKNLIDTDKGFRLYTQDLFNGIIWPEYTL